MLSRPLAFTPVNPFEMAPCVAFCRGEADTAAGEALSPDGVGGVAGGALGDLDVGLCATSFARCFKTDDWLR